MLSEKTDFSLQQRGVLRCRRKENPVELYVKLSWFPLALLRYCKRSKDNRDQMTFFFCILCSEINKKTFFKYQVCLSKIIK